jgi:hypothetical protein
VPAAIAVTSRGIEAVGPAQILKVPDLLERVSQRHIAAVDLGDQSWNHL